MSDHLGLEFGLGHVFEHDFGKGKVNLTAGFYGSTGLNKSEIFKIVLSWFGISYRNFPYSLIESNYQQ